MILTDVEKFLLADRFNKAQQAIKDSHYFTKETENSWTIVDLFCRYALEIATKYTTLDVVLKSEIINAFKNLTDVAAIMAYKVKSPDDLLDIEHPVTGVTSEITFTMRIDYLIHLIYKIVTDSEKFLREAKQNNLFPEFKIILTRIKALFPAQQFDAQIWKISHPDFTSNTSKSLFAESLQLLNRQMANTQLAKLKPLFPDATLIEDHDKCRLKIPDLTDPVGFWLRTAAADVAPVDAEFMALVVLAKNEHIHALDSAGPSTGKTALHRAAERGNASKVTALLDNGAKPLADLDQRMPADLAPPKKFSDQILQRLRGPAPTVNRAVAAQHP